MSLRKIIKVRYQTVQKIGGYGTPLIEHKTNYTLVVFEGKWHYSYVIYCNSYQHHGYFPAYALNNIEEWIREQRVYGKKLKIKQITYSSK